MSSSTHRYLNAINHIVEANIGALMRIYHAYGGDWKRAWNSNLQSHVYAYPDGSHRNIRALQKKTNPDKLWQIVESEGLDIITILDKDYPSVLRTISNPPFLLYIRGSLKAVRSYGLAVVGTRKITPYGKNVVKDIVGSIAQASLPIYSGMAYGVDTLAHQVTLDAGGTTIAILANGLDQASLHPRYNEQLARRIIETGGALVSEYAPGYKAHPYSFPQRNRILSGLCRGTLVIEGDIKSGTMITARYAIEQNRDVFAVPGRMYDQLSAGPNWLIQNNAKLVTCADDIIKEYDDITAQLPLDMPITSNDPVEQAILQSLVDGPCSIDQIIEQTKLDVTDVTSAMMLLELNKKIKNLGNDTFVLYS